MNRDRLHLAYIQRAIGSVQRLAEAGKAALMADEDKRAAMLYYLQTLSESAGQISADLRAAHPDVQWAHIRGFRNRIAHEYLSIDFDLVWLIIQTELPALRAAVEALLAQMPPDPPEPPSAP